MKLPLIRPQWDVPGTIHAAMTTRQGGVSHAPYDSLNLGYATADDPNAVAKNEGLVLQALGLVHNTVRWVHQVHGANVTHAEQLQPAQAYGQGLVDADAIVSHTPGLVCAIKVADCMPVLFASNDGSVVAAAHAGWRGLLGGVLENTIAACEVRPERLRVWLGPCIGPQAFEVGVEVRAAFVQNCSDAALYFKSRHDIGHEGKFLCDLYALARQRLHAVGVTHIYGEDHRCTFSETMHFFSHRRNPTTGRMLALIGF